MKIIILKGILFFFAIFFILFNSNAQVYPVNHNFTANWLCEECNVINPERAVDDDFSSAATIIQTASSFGSEIYMNIIFSTHATAGEIVGIVVEDLDFRALDTTLLSSIILATFNDNVSNNDSRNSTQINFYPYHNSTSKYILEFQSSSSFNVIRFAMKGVKEGALDKINVYYAYYGSEPVPIEMNLFKAEQINSKVKLEWQTASEFNNDYFSIERSHNAIDFKEIAFVDGAGTSVNSLNYSFEDVNPLKGISYYRLKQTDFDQNFKYYHILPFTYKIKDMHFDIYPNPLQGEELNVLFLNAKDVLVEIRDMTGKQVFNHSSLSNQDRFENTLKIQAKLIPGIYYVILSSDNNTQTKKLIVI